MSIKINFLSKTPAQTRKVGENLSKNLFKTDTKRKKALVLGLIGDLGGGKTTFLQGFARGLGIKKGILSPTFVIIKRFPLDLKDRQFNNFYHLDCYRVSKNKEILDLGFREIISCPENIVAIEWADKIMKILPKDSLFLKFDFIDEKKRKINLEMIEYKRNGK